MTRLSSGVLCSLPHGFLECSPSSSFLGGSCFIKGSVEGSATCFTCISQSPPGVKVVWSCGHVSAIQIQSPIMSLLLGYSLGLLHGGWIVDLTACTRVVGAEATYRV